MGTTYHLMAAEAPDGKPVKILERDAETEQLIGEYVGYRNARRGVYKLYPKYNPFAAKNGELGKKEISEFLVKWP